VLKGYLNKILQISISPSPITFLAFSGDSALKVNITDSLLGKYFVQELQVVADNGTEAIEAV
jgi:hypothetical protein